MGSETTFDAGTEQFLAPDAGAGMDLQPFEPDERIIWAFQRGLANHGPNDKDVVNFLKTIVTPEGQVLFTVGFVRGMAVGAKQAIADYSRFVANSLNLFVSAAEKARLVFDGNVVAGSIAVYLTAPGSPERAAVLEKLAQYFDEKYPDIAAALRAVKLAGVVLEAVADWLSTPGAAMEVAMTISSVLGQIAGTLLDGVRSYLNDAEKLGRGTGFLIGNLVMWIIFDLIGFPFSVMLDLFETALETAIETGKAK